MGYRSEVAIIVTDRATATFESAALAIDPEFFQNFDKIYLGRNCKVYYASSIKWHDAYTVTRATSAGLEAIDDLGEYVVTRIGDDESDNERNGYLDAGYIIRSIELPEEVEREPPVPQAYAVSRGAREVEIE